MRTQQKWDKSGKCINKKNFQTQFYIMCNRERDDARYLKYYACDTLILTFQKICFMDVMYIYLYFLSW